MTKNLNIRLEDEIFDTFTQYCESNRYSKTEILKDYIQRLINGELQPFCNDSNDTVMIPPTQGLDEAIANHPKLKALEEKLEGLIDVVNSIRNDIVMASNDATIDSNDDVTQGNDIMSDDFVMTSNDVSLQNNSSENELEGASNDNQVSNIIEEANPLETAKSEELPNTLRGDNSETSHIQGFQDKGVDEVEQAIAKLETATSGSLREIMKEINSNNGEKGNSFSSKLYSRGSQEERIEALKEVLKGELREIAIKAINLKAEAKKR